MSIWDMQANNNETNIYIPINTVKVIDILTPSLKCMQNVRKNIGDIK